MHACHTFAFTIAVLAVTGPAAGRPSPASVTAAAPRVLPFAGVALGINDRGDVVGHSNFSAFLWTEDQGRVSLGTLPGSPLCQATAVNNRRHVAGWCWGGALGEARAFVWSRATGMRDIGRGIATAINDLDEVAGGGEATSQLQQAWRWSGGRRQLLGLEGTQSMAMGINEPGHLVVSGPSPDRLRVFIWRRESGLEDLGIIGVGFEINDADAVSTNAALTWNPQLVPDDQGPIDIVMPPGKYGAATGLNSMTIVAGTATDNDSEAPFAFMWTRAGGYTEIGSAYSRAEKINQAAEIAGSQQGADGVTRPAIWRLRVPLHARLHAATIAIRAHVARGAVEYGPAQGVLRQMQRIGDADERGASSRTLKSMVLALETHVDALLRRRRLPAFDVWLIRTLELAADDLR